MIIYMATRIEEREKRKAGIRQGFCWDCSMEIAIGELRCQPCRAKQRLRERRYDLNHREQRRIRAKYDMTLRFKAGKCTHCAKSLDEDADEGCVSCVNCRAGLKGSRYETLYNPDATGLQSVSNR